MFFKKDSLKKQKQKNECNFENFEDFTWKCLVFPGVDDTETFLYCNKELIVELFPTFGYPTY